MIKMNFDMIVFKEEETYVAYCPELDLSSCGNSVPHAKEMLRTAIRLFLEEAEKMGTLNDILSEVNYTVNHDGRYVPPKIIAAEEVSL
jgi:predicted RNase H-like HicB family nuclease